MCPSDAPYQPQSPRAVHHCFRFAAELCAAALGVLCYAGTLSNGYCYDDGPIVANNPQVVGSGSWQSIWTSDYWGGAGRTWEHRDLLYRPVAVTSFRIIHALAPDSTWLQHAVNILLHAILSALVVRLVRRLNGDVRVAWIAGLLFAALPIHSEVVASVVGRADQLATLGVVAAMLFYLHAMRPGAHRAFWYIVIAAAVFVAMASKESGAVAPICVLVADWFYCRKLAVANAKRSRWFSLATLRRVWFLAIPVGIYLALRINALDGAIVQSAPLTKTINVLVGAPVWQRALGAVQLWGMYWVKTAWPGVLNIDYSINAVRLATSLFDPYVLVGLATLGALVAWAGRGDPIVGCLVALCVLCYLPTSNSFVLMRTFFAERVWYLPSVWVVMLVAFGLGPVLKSVAWVCNPCTSPVENRCHKGLWDRFLVRVTKKTLVHVAVAFALAAMVGRCWVRNGDWKDNRSLYAAAYRDHPDGAQALRLYGRVLVGAGEIHKGIAMLRHAIDIDLGYTDAYRDLGRALLAAGRYEEALSFLQSAEMQAPGDVATLDALEQTRRAVAKSRGDAIAALRARVAEAPDDIAAHLALVAALRDVGDLRGALAHLQQNRSRFNDDARWAHEQAITLVMLNELDRAIDAYRRAVQLAPKNVAAAVEFAMLLLERDKGGDVGEAWRIVRDVASIAPNDVSVLVCRGELLAHDGHTEEAIEAYRQAVALEPTSSPRRNALIERLRALGG